MREAQTTKDGSGSDFGSGRIQGIEKKLGNENFTSRAPAEVVDRERSTLASLQTQLSSIEQSIRGLS